MYYGVWYPDELGAEINREIQDSHSFAFSSYGIVNPLGVEEKPQDSNYYPRRRKTAARLPPAPPLPSSSQSSGRKGYFPSMGHQCDHFAFPPPPPAGGRRLGPRRKFEFYFKF